MVVRGPCPNKFQDLIGRTDGSRLQIRFAYFLFSWVLFFPHFLLPDFIEFLGRFNQPPNPRPHCEHLVLPT